MEAYDPKTVFSSIDLNGRYAYGNQPHIAAWNLARFAETLLPLLSDEPDEAVALATEVIAEFPAQYQTNLLNGQRAKLGLRRGEPDDDRVDTALIDDWLTLLYSQHVDFTLAWRRLADAASGDQGQLSALFGDPHVLDPWLARWKARCASEVGVAGSERAKAMRAVNPVIIARNHRVDEALAAASDSGDFVPFGRLLAAVRRPYVECAEQVCFAEPAPAAVTACYRTFCGT
jgi:uncharacterized protein YdiU (UPF0061 family)